MLILQDESTLLVNDTYTIDVSDFPRGIPYDVAGKDGAIRLIPWIDAHTRRVDMILDTNNNRVSVDGWDFLGVYCRNRDHLSHFEHMIWSYGISKDRRIPNYTYSKPYSASRITLSGHAEQYDPSTEYRPYPGAVGYIPNPDTELTS